MTSEVELTIKNKIFEIPNQTEKYNVLCDLVWERLKPEYEFYKFDMEFVVGLLYPKIDAHVSA